MKLKDENSFINSIIDYLKKCPVFEENSKVNINYLGNKIEDYCLEAVPAERTIKRFINGEKEKQKVFVFASRKTYSQDDIENMANYDFFEELAEWIELQNDIEKFPDITNINNIQEIESIEILDSPYICAISETEARYQTEIKITYIQN